MTLKRAVATMLVLVLLLVWPTTVFAASAEDLPGTSTASTDAAESTTGPPAEAETEAPAETPTKPQTEAPAEAPTEDPLETGEEIPDYARMEAEYANTNGYSGVLSYAGASNSYLVGGQQVESVFQLELFDDLAGSDLAGTPYVKYNVSAAEAGSYTLQIGAAVENVEDPAEFYIPVLVNGTASKATCADFDGTNGIYVFSVTVQMAAGKNEVYCIAFDADQYLSFLNYDTSSTAVEAVSFDYLDIPSGLTALEKDAAAEEEEEDTQAAEEEGEVAVPEILDLVSNDEDRGFVLGNTYTHMRTGPETANMGQHSGVKAKTDRGNEHNIAYLWHYIKELGWQNSAYCLDLTRGCGHNAEISKRHTTVLTGEEVADQYGLDVALAILLADEYEKFTSGEYTSNTATGDMQNRRAAAQAIIWRHVHKYWSGWWESYDSWWPESLNAYADEYYYEWLEEIENYDESTSAFDLANSKFVVTKSGLVYGIPEDQPLITLIHKEMKEEDPKVTLQKSIDASAACIAQLEGNSMYSLAGAKYTISVDGKVVETLTTDASGCAVSAQTYKPGTVLTIQETAAPPGFLLDTTVYSHTVTEGINTIAVKDKPVLDPPFAMTKVDKDTYDAQGNSSFSGAVFQWEYFDNYSWSGTPLRTWYFQTNANGYVDYDPDYFASAYDSDELYTDKYGAPAIPLGTVKITEIRNSLGYIVLYEPLYCSIIEDTTTEEGATVVWTEASWQHLLDIAAENYEAFGVYEPVDEDLFGALTIQKLDKETGAAPPEGADFSGCEFSVYNCSTGPVKVGDNAVAQPGEVCCVLTMDTSGQVSTGAVFPIGTYEVRETKGNSYYQCNTSWSFRFDITGTETSPDITAQCTNTLHPATIHVQKTDGADKMLPGARFVLEWSEDSTTWQQVTKSETVVPGGCSSPELGEDGSLITGTDGKVSFTGLYPLGFYRIAEVETQNGYTLLKEPILVEKLLSENSFACCYQIANDETFVLPMTGGPGLWMIIPSVTLAFLTLFLGAFAGTPKNVRFKKMRSNYEKE